MIDSLYLRHEAGRIQHAVLVNVEDADMVLGCDCHSCLIPLSSLLGQFARDDDGAGFLWVKGVFDSNWHVGRDGTLHGEGM